MSLHHTAELICELCESKLQEADPSLRVWFRNHIKPNFKDAHVSWAYRDEASQEQAFADHKSRLHFPYSAHNKMPALALDLFEIDGAGEGVWNPKFFEAVNQYNKDKDIPLKWGGYFRLLGDAGHFEVVIECP